MRVTYPYVPPLTPNLNFLVKSKSEVKPLPKLTKSLFIVLHVVFGLDFGFIKFDSRRMRIFVKLLTLFELTIIFVVLNYTFFVSHKNSSTLWYVFDMSVYYVFGLSLLFSKKTYHDLQLDLYSLDLEIEMDSSSYKMQHLTILGFIFVIVFRMIGFLFYCDMYEEYCGYPEIVKYLYSIAKTGHNLALLVYSLLFQCVYFRMKKLTSIVKNDSADIITCNYHYKYIVDIVQKSTTCFDLVFVVALTYITIDVTLKIYLPFVNESLSTGYTLDMPLAYILVIQEMVMMFGPAFTAGLLTSQVEKLRLALYDRLVKDQKHAIDIKMFISYIDIRPLKFKIWMVIPLDWSLPVIVVNISVTYLIVMIQFTQKN